MQKYLWWKKYITVMQLVSLSVMYMVEIKPSILVRCPDFRGLNVCTVIEMGPWMDKYPDYCTH